MALLDLLPSIDDRSYDDIVSEAQTRLPRYTSELTDLNPGDPAMALVELFAWMSEMLIFRLGQTPAQNYLKFLELIGIELLAAQPARADVSFAVRSGFADSVLSVPERTQVSAETPDGPIVFETEHSLTVFAAELDAVQVHDGYSYRELSLDNEDVDSAFHPFGTSPTEGAALLIGFTAASGMPDAELNLTVWSAHGERASTTAGWCGDTAAAAAAPADVVWEYFTGSEWRAMTFLSDASLALTRSGLISLRTPAAGEMAAASIGRISDAPRYWIRARLQAAHYARAPEILAIRHNTVSVIQAQTIRDELLGGSDGTMSQELSLAHTPVLDGTLVLEVDEGNGWQQWTEVDDFFASAADDLHYMLNRTNGRLRFGSGDHGHIPVANLQRPSNSIMARTYRSGGGTAGNVSPGSITTLLGAIEGLDASRISNLFAAHGGKAEETLAQAQLRVPHYLRGNDRAVTAEDFEQLAVQVDSVRRAVALPRYSPECPDIEIPGAISVIVVPDSDSDTPVPSDHLLRNVCSYLNPRRLLTTELYVLPPRYVSVRLVVELVARLNADPQATQASALQAVNEFLDPFVGGEEGVGWPFGGTLFYSAIYRRLLVAGVQRVVSLQIELDGVAAAECRDVPIPADALLQQLQHDIRVITDPELL